MSVHETELQSFIDTAPDAMVVVDRAGTIRLANDRAVSMFGHGELVGSSLEELLPESLAEVHRRHRERFWTDPAPRAMGEDRELVARRADGSTFDVDVSLGLLDVGGEQHVAAAVRDVSDRVEAARARATASFIVRSSHDAVYSLDQERRVTSWNLGAERLTGRRARAVVGTVTDTPLGLVDADLEAELFARASRGEPLERFHTEVVRSDGSTVPISLTLAAIRDDRHRIVGVSGIAHDNSEEVLAQEMLAEVQSRIAETQRLAQVGLWAYHVESGEVQWSAGLYEIAGVSPLDFGGHITDHLALVGADDRDRVHRELEESIREGTTFQTEYPIERPDGERRWILSRADVVADSAGGAPTLRGICQDLTERQRLVEALRRADRLKDEFLGVISHELRTPLTSIVGFSRLLDDRLTGEEAKWASIISRNGAEMHGMVERILDFTRMQGGKVKLTIGTHDAGSMIDDVVPLVTTALADHELELDVEPGLSLRADPDAVRRVLVNLLTNAAKFSEAGTTIVLRAAPRDDGTARLSVVDSGPGIPPDEIEAVFDRFHQVRSNVIATKRGAGVGLSIVKGYTELMGGTVGVDSELGKGSTFWVDLARA